MDVYELAACTGLSTSDTSIKNASEGYDTVFEVRKEAENLTQLTQINKELADLKAQSDKFGKAIDKAIESAAEIKLLQGPRIKSKS